MSQSKAEIFYDRTDPRNLGWAYYGTPDGENAKSGEISNLDDLLVVLRDHEEIAVYAKNGQHSSQPAGLDELPTFGGPEPEDTEGVWSWDSARLLVGTCSDDFEIVFRQDVSLKPDVEAWNIPPANRGQTIEISYGIDSKGRLWARDLDRSGPTATYRLLGHQGDKANTDWEPWNRTPAIDTARG